MKIGKIRLKISPIILVVGGFFAILLAIAYILGRDSTLLVWGIPTLILLMIMPLGLNYLSQKEYADVRPQYEREARSVRIKLINLNMVGEPVRIEGVVEKVRFQFLNRPQYIVADRSGEISVKMFTHPGVTIKVGDVVEVLGMVMKRYLAAGDAIVNGVSIKKIDKVVEVKPQAKGK
ncbi:MAG: hypothetical protein A4E36_02278 [Methanoregulaceae archaeon PtaB.Bin009]|jgi:hypothetical protein|nr:MAG: hypothetical protein A4E36_02278 [Methanoregulaceae archaeon PtaB.Bin009]OPY38054.1 MAG: hypothetical protein A4E41_02056 [Methanoregulaceae archaeon PtaU1.Bin066]HNQ29436.1 nucleotide-binding protein [Methanolinea sp.]